MTDIKSYLGKLDETFELYFVKKAPFSLPDSVKEVIVKFGPWIILILLIMSAPLILGVLGLGSMLMPLGYMGGLNTGLMYMVTMALTVVSMVLEILALPGLFKRQMKGWTFAYYAALVGVLLNIITIMSGGLVGLIGSAIGLYFLYQIKSYYK